ncbi:MAG: response regulator [Lachnospiraceae bacterium]|nr:response regulator [Lachnospiraceae bacterium]
MESVYGGGSNFTLSLNQVIADDNLIDRDREKIDDIVSQEIADKMWLPSVKALVVDDEAVSREVSVKTLLSFEMNIDTAESGMAAIDKVMNNDYDVVFMDLAMPVMNGTDTMKEIRGLDGEKYLILPIISLDYDTISDNSDVLLENGFTGTLLKPMDIRRVAAILKDCLPEDKIKEKSSNVAEYISNSKYAEGLYKLEEKINIKKAIEKIGGSIDVFNKILRSFYKKNNNLKEIIESHGISDTRWFKQRIHTLKASSYNVGAYAFSQETARIEAAINADNKTYMNNNYEKLLVHLEELMNCIGEYIDYIDAVENTEAVKNTATSEAAEDVEADMGNGSGIDIGMLKKLDELLGENVSDEVEAIMAEINKNIYIGEDSDFIAVLNESISDNDCEKVHELITTYIDLNS